MPCSTQKTCRRNAAAPRLSQTSLARLIRNEDSPGIWWGSRLAVAGEYRRVGALGTALIRLAVGSAHARGCSRFLANVQAQNGPLFTRLNWRTLGELTLHGHPHLNMEADLAHYPPIAEAEAVAGMHASARLAA